MRKAVIVNDKIQVFDSVPKTWNNILGFNNLSNSELENHGFYDVVDAEGYSPILHNRGKLEFHESFNKFIYKKIDKTLDSIENLKAEKIKELKKMAFGLLQNTDWYCARKTELGTEIPDSIIAERKKIRDKVVEREKEINDLDTQSKVALYNVVIFDFNPNDL